MCSFELCEYITIRVSVATFQLTIIIGKKGSVSYMQLLDSSKQITCLISYKQAGQNKLKHKLLQYTMHHVYMVMCSSIQRNRSILGSSIQR